MTNSLLAVCSQEFNGENAGRVARLDSNGAIDDSFAVGTGADDEVFCLGRRSDGRLFVGGRFGTFDGCLDGRIVRLLPEGQLDVGFNPGTGVSGGVVSVSAEADGRVLLAGDICMVNGQVRKRMARLYADGSLDATFNPGAGPDGFIFPMERFGDGRWFVGGTFGHFDGYERRHIALLEQDGALDQSFNPMEGATGPDAGVLALCMQPGQGLIAGGFFTGFGGFQRGGIVRLFMDGSVDASFAEQAGFSGYVVAIERLASGHLLVGGAFDSYDGIPRNSLAKLDPNGDLDLSFNPELNPGDMVMCLAEQSDGAILVGGQVGIAPRRNTSWYRQAVARWRV
ncbi:MAG: delta-60 repeat domain-containing protein [Flavobacteriales bacterium]|nr:delta-60 repeat domain-containing protein [Flavobacteriales bacterium]